MSCTAEHPIEVRAIADGQILTDSEFPERDHVAEAFYASTVAFYRRSDNHGMEITVALIRGDDVVYETTITP